MTFAAAIVGLGQIGIGYDARLEAGRYVYTHARALWQHRDFRIVAAVDPAAGSRAAMSSLYGVVANDRLASVSLEESPDVVVIATDTRSHHTAVEAVLSRWSPRAILCEKPLGYDLVS